VNGRQSSDRDTAAADEREKISGSQKITLGTRELARYLPDNNSTFSKEFQRRNFVGWGLTSVFAQ
jgi:IS30 family transposase